MNMTVNAAMANTVTNVDAIHAATALDATALSIPWRPIKDF